MRSWVGLVLFAAAVAVACWLWLRGSKKPAPTGAPGPSAVHLRGFVRASGQPLAGAAVELYGSPKRAKTTGADGTFDFGVLALGGAQLRATARGMRDETVYVSYRDLGTPIQITMSPCAGLLRGRVRDVDGAPLRARIEYHRPYETDADGGFELCPQYGSIFSVYSDGYLPRQVSIPTAGPLEIVLERGGVVAGRVLQRDRDVPIGGVAVFANDRRVTSASDGAFRLGGLDTGRYVVFARGDGWETGPVDVAITRGATSTVTLRAQPNLAVRGRVVEGDDPVARAMVCLDAAPQLCATTDADGRFILHTLALGEHRIGVAGKLVSPARVTLGPRTPELVLRVRSPSDGLTATIVGRVVRLGAPVAGASVAGTSTLADGSFVVQVPPGPVTLEAYSNELLARGGPITLTVADGETREVEFELDQEGAIGGVVIDQDGQPVPKVAVFVEDETGADSASIRTGADGSFYIAPLALGVYRAHVLPTVETVTGFRDASRETIRVARSDTQTTGIRLVIDTRVGTISGRIVDAEGTPLAGATAWVAGAQPTGEPQPRTGPDGRFTIRNVPLGAHAVYADGGNGRWGASAAVETGRDDVIVTVSGPIAIEGTVDGLGSAPRVVVPIQHDVLKETRAVGRHFRLDDVPAGEVAITAIGDGLAIVQSVRIDPPLTRVALRAGTRGRLAVRATDEVGASLSGIDCTFSPWMSMFYLPALQTDRDGRVTLEGPSSQFRVRCESRVQPRFSGENWQVNLPAAGTRELVIPVLLR